MKKPGVRAPGRLGLKPLQAGRVCGPSSAALFAVWRGSYATVHNPSLSYLADAHLRQGRQMAATNAYVWMRGKERQRAANHTPHGRAQHGSRASRRSTAGRHDAAQHGTVQHSAARHSLLSQSLQDGSEMWQR